MPADGMILNTLSLHDDMLLLIRSGKTMNWRVFFSLNLGHKLGVRFCVGLSVILRRVKHVFKLLSLSVIAAGSVSTV